MQKKKAGFITSNLPNMINVFRKKKISVLADMSIDSWLSIVMNELDFLNAYSGIYIVNHLTKRMTYLGRREDWQKIVKKLNNTVLARDGNTVFESEQYAR